MANGGVAREIAQIGIDTTGDHVIVSRAEMNVAADPIGFPPDDETHLRMRLEAAYPVHNMHTFIFQFPGPFNIVFFVESRFELDQDRNLLAVDACLHERIDNGDFGLTR